MRDDATSRLPYGSPTYQVTNVSDNVSDQYGELSAPLASFTCILTLAAATARTLRCALLSIFREVLGEMHVPFYATDSALPGSKLIIDENNDPVYQGLVTVPFVVYIPHSCANGTHTPCPIVNYGHGIFSSRFEVCQRARPQRAAKNIANDVH